MTNQEIYDTVKEHLLKQAERSVQDHPEGASCLYRGPNGLKCAAGILIPEELYDSTMEGGSFNFVIENYPEVEKLLDLKPDGINLILDLQSMHDCNLPEYWLDHLDYIAKKYNLVF